jgi:hypothetical protein
MRRLLFLLTLFGLLIASTLGAYRIIEVPEAAAKMNLMQLTGGVPVAGEAGLTVDVWQNFEFDTLNTTNLDANDHYATTGRWSITDGSTRLAMTSSGVKNLISLVGTTADTGASDAYGMSYNAQSDDASAYILFTFVSPPTTFTTGFWYKTPASFPNWNHGWDILDLRTAGTTAHRITNVGEISGYQELSYGGGSGQHYQVTAGTWYYVALKYVRNASSTFQIFNSTGTSVFSYTFTGLDDNIVGVRYGGSDCSIVDGGINITVYIDDILISFDGSAWPIGP